MSPNDSHDLLRKVPEVKQILPSAPESIPEIEQLLERAIHEWMHHGLRPRLSPEIERRWDGYVKEWIATKDMPLFVRVSKGAALEKGCVFERHGRTLIRCDNSPAQWIFCTAYEAPEKSFDDLSAAWQRREIPVAMVVTRAAREHRDWMRLPSLGNAGVNNLGWELSHRREVRLQGRVTNAPLEAYEQHFRLLMSVSNMVLTPRRLGLNHLIDWYFRASEETSEQ